MAIQQTQQLYEQVIGELTERLVSELGDRIDMIIVYGSVARGDSDSDSDIDLMIVSSHKDEIYDKVLDISYYNDLKHETLTAVNLVTPQELENSLARGEPFLRNALSEGRAIYGEERFRNYQRTLQIS